MVDVITFGDVDVAYFGESVGTAFGDLVSEVFKARVRDFCVSIIDEAF